MSDLVGRQLGNYLIEALIGEGGMGRVYRARDVSKGKHYALKVLKEDLAAEESDFRRRFHKEVELLSKLHHRRIVRVRRDGEIVVRDGCEGDGLPYLVMDYIVGPDGKPETILDRVYRQGERKGLPSKKVRKWGIQIAKALQYIHSTPDRVIHRDLSLNNILIDSDGSAVLADFGLAKALSEEKRRELERSTTHSQVTGRVVGKILYMSPEQKMSEAELKRHHLTVDHRTDIYSFGICIYEALTGDTPAAGTTKPSKVVADLPKAWDAIFERCVEQRPERRFDSADDLLAALRTVGVLDDYRIVKRIGRGPSGATYRATRGKDGQDFVIKYPSPDPESHPDRETFKADFKRQTNLLRRLTHPNIAKLQDAGFTGSAPYLVAEYVVGISGAPENLRDHVRPDEGGRLAVWQAGVWAINIVEGLKHLHDSGILHLGVKPGNVLVDGNGDAKLMDSGLAGLVGCVLMSLQKTIVGRNKTESDAIDFMAPELRGGGGKAVDHRADGGEAVDHRADIFSVGVLLYFMLAGRVPSGRYKPPSESVSDLPSEWDAIVGKCLEDKPIERYSSADELLVDLRDATCFGGFRLLRKIDADGMGDTYQAEHIVSGRVCALKIISPQLAKTYGFLKRLDEEIPKAKRLHHRNIVRVTSAAESEGLHYVTMDLMGSSGERPRNLYEHRQGRGSEGYDDEYIKKRGIQIVDALVHAHGRGAQHRDIRPGSLLLDDALNIRLMGFGLPRAAGEDFRRLRATDPNVTGQPTVVPGGGSSRIVAIQDSVYFGAPELRTSGSKDVDHRADIYSVGAVLHWFLTDTRGNVLQPPSGIVPGIWAGWDGVIERCVTSDPGDRYASAKELRRAIKKLRAVPRWKAFLRMLFVVLFLGAAGGLAYMSATTDRGTGPRPADWSAASDARNYAQQKCAGEVVFVSNVVDRLHDEISVDHGFNDRLSETRTLNRSAEEEFANSRPLLAVAKWGELEALCLEIDDQDDLRDTAVADRTRANQARTSAEQSQDVLNKAPDLLKTCQDRWAEAEDYLTNTYDFEAAAARFKETENTCGLASTFATAVKNIEDAKGVYEDTVDTDENKPLLDLFGRAEWRSIQQAVQQAESDTVKLQDLPLELQDEEKERIKAVYTKAVNDVVLTLDIAKDRKAAEGTLGVVREKLEDAGLNPDKDPAGPFDEDKEDQYAVVDAALKGVTEALVRDPENQNGLKLKDFLTKWNRAYAAHLVDEAKLDLEAEGFKPSEEPRHPFYPERRLAVKTARQTVEKAEGIDPGSSDAVELANQLGAWLALEQDRTLEVDLSTDETLEFHLVTLPDFVSDVYVTPDEISVAQYRAVMGDHFVDEYMRTFQGEPLDLDDMPVVFVTLANAREFCNKANELHKDRIAASNESPDRSEYVFRLPTQTEWKVLARAAADREASEAAGRRFNWGADNTNPQEWSGADGFPVAAASTEDFDPQLTGTELGDPRRRRASGQAGTSRVPQTEEPDERAVFHLFGNVWEICFDGGESEALVARGGSWLDPKPAALKDYLSDNDVYPPLSGAFGAEASFPHVGFRIVYALPLEGGGGGR